jgi:hypothetical protein
MSQRPGPISASRVTHPRLPAEAKAHPMSPVEAAKLICESHARTVESERGFAVDWGGAPPDLTRI